MGVAPHQFTGIEVGVFPDAWVPLAMHPVLFSAHRSLVDDAGAGNDWRCVVTWRLPGATATGSAIYQLDVTPDGRYVADGDGPQQVNGFFQIRTSTGDVPNPLWQFDSSVDLLSPTSDR